MVARARRDSRTNAGGAAALFDEIYRGGARADMLPESVTQALAALTLARSSRHPQRLAPALADAPRHAGR